MESPESLLSSRGCVAQTLTVSDQHVTILVSKTPDSNEKSLLKLTLVPFHRDIFQDDDSQNILSFLRNYNFRLTSESGAEYSYHDAMPKSRNWFSRWISWSSLPDAVGSFKVELISPASERQIQRAMPKPGVVLVEERPEMYEQITKPYIQSIVESGSLSWIENVVTGKKEKERLLLDKDDYILNVDTKWRSHPDALTVPRSEWHGHKSVSDLYCLAIAKDGGVASLRDLRAKHVPMLKSILEDGSLAIEKIYGVPRNQLRIFVHNQPQFYHFHVHFTRLENEVGCQVERGHLVSDIVQNLEMNGDFYMNRTICYRLPTTDKLYGLLKVAQEEKTVS